MWKKENKKENFFLFHKSHFAARFLRKKEKVFDFRNHTSLQDFCGRKKLRKKKVFYFTNHISLQDSCGAKKLIKKVVLERRKLREKKFLISPFHKSHFTARRRFMKNKTK